MTATVKKRPESLRGRTIKTTCGCGNIYITINELDGRPFEVFVAVGKSGSCIATTVGALAISISHGLRAGIPLEEYKKAFIGFQCLSPLNRVQNQGRIASSCIDAIARVFKDYLDIKEQMDQKTPAPQPSPTPTLPIAPAPAPAPAPTPITIETRPREMTGKTCRQCGGPVYISEGCDHCILCGHSENCGN
jgi:ribonucleoside-diphosphate reductase alpha chain